MSKEINVNYPGYVNKAEIKSDDKGYGKNNPDFNFKKIEGEMFWIYGYGD